MKTHARSFYPPGAIGQVANRAAKSGFNNIDLVQGGTTAIHAGGARCARFGHSSIR